MHYNEANAPGDLAQIVRREPTYDVFIKINNIELNKHFRDLVRLHTLAYAGLLKNLQLLDMVVASPPLVGTKSLSNSSFLMACNIDNLARAAPDRMFVSENTIRVTFPKNILDEFDRHLMIVGAPGFGKTSFCRWNALRDLERFTTDKSTIVPVYIPLHQLAKRPLGSFAEMFLPNRGQSALLAKDWTETINSPKMRIRLYLDGLDEVASVARRRELVGMVRDNVATDARFQVILTARAHVHGGWLDWLPRISLGEFDKDEIRELVSNWLGKDSNERNEFFLQLDRVPPLERLMHIPLLSTLIILLFRRTGRLPENKARLYETWTELLCGGWDLAKGIVRESRFNQRTKLLVLTALASKVHNARQSTFGSEELRAAIQETQSRSNQDDWEGLRDELIEDGSVCRTGEGLHFPHLSFQEFLAAKDVMMDPHSIRADALLEGFLYGDDWSKEVLVFYIALVSRPQRTTSWLLFEMDRHGEKVPDTRIMNLLRGLVEAFPEFSYEDFVGFSPSSFRSHRILEQLRKAHAELNGYNANL